MAKVAARKVRVKHLYLVEANFGGLHFLTFLRILILVALLSPEQMNLWDSVFKIFVCMVGSHMVFVWIHCRDVRKHCMDILIERK